MPVLSRFYGIIHALYGDDVAVITVQNGEVLEGYLPVKVMAMVREWIEKNEIELLHMWETQEFKALAPLE